MSASTPGADVMLEGESERQLMLAALGTLPPGLRAVVVAHDIDEQTMKDIADQLGTPLSTLYKWRLRGIAALADALHKLRG